MEPRLDKYQPRNEVESLVAAYTRANGLITGDVPADYLKGMKSDVSY